MSQGMLGLLMILAATGHAFQPAGFWETAVLMPRFRMAVTDLSP